MPTDTSNAILYLTRRHGDSFVYMLPWQHKCLRNRRDRQLVPPQQHHVPCRSKVASIRPGLRWLSVYEELLPYGVAVNGGREGIVVVGGLVRGDGVSLYSARQGLACDGIVNAEVVLANGDIFNANATSCADLWKALKVGEATLVLSRV